MKRLLVLLLALILAGAVFAETRQPSRAKLVKPILSGTVYDTNHAVIVSGEVVAQSLEGKEYWATTNGEGVYKFELPAGTYRIEANAPGFCPKRFELFKVRNSRPGPLDFVLDVAHSAVLDIEGRNRPCAQKTMIKKKQREQDRRSIAE